MKYLFILLLSLNCFSYYSKGDRVVVDLNSLSDFAVKNCSQLGTVIDKVRHPDVASFRVKLDNCQEPSYWYDAYNLRSIKHRPRR